MEHRPKRIFDARLIIALAIISAGLILLLRNLGIDIGINVWDWWPLVLIAIGAGHIMQPAENRQNWNGLIFIVIGGLFLLNNLDIYYFSFSDIWPFILILIGIMILRQTTVGRKKDAATGDDINISYILGGGDRSFASRNLKGGHISAIMGGGKIDLREAEMEGDSIVIETFAFWGGIELIVPRHWRVNMQGTPLMGGMENKTYYASDSEGGLEVPQTGKRLIIKGMAIMGGVEVKN